MKYILAFDQGTTSSRSIVFDHSSNIVSSSQQEFTQLFPNSGWVEHDPGEIWDSQIRTAIDALSDGNIDKTDIAAIGITNQRETTIIWDRYTGKPICNAIVWQDRRTSEYCESMKRTHGGLVTEITGLPIDAYFSASKINWILDNVDDARRRADAGELCFGTVDTWLVWKLTGGREHVTDVSNASRTMLFNIHELKWDDDLLELFEIPAGILPEVKPSSEVFGEVRETDELEGVKIAGIAGDQQAALFGQLCVENGATKSTYGTGCFLLQNTGVTPVASENHLLTTIAWQIGESVEYALEGSVFIGGAVVQWLRDALEIVRASSEVEELSESVPDNGGVYFVPAFAGLGTPYWDQNARGTIVGLTRGTGRAHIARAAIESIAFQTADLLDAMQLDSGIRLSELRVDGGATKNDSLMQFQADILGIPVVRSRVTETTALGAAYLAGLAVGFWNDTSDLSEHWQEDKRFDPQMEKAVSRSMRERWYKAVTRALDWE